MDSRRTDNLREYIYWSIRTKIIHRVKAKISFEEGKVQSSGNPNDRCLFSLNRNRLATSAVALNIEIKGYAVANPWEVVLNQINLHTMTNLITVTLEHQTDPAIGDLGWKMNGNPVPLMGLPDRNEPYLFSWNHGMGVRDEVWRDRSNYRVVIKEYEIFDADGPMVDYLISPAQADRMVFSDMINLAEFE